MADWPKNGYTTALTIAAGATDVTAGAVVGVGDQEEVLVVLKATGAAAGSAGNVTFYMTSSADGVNYSSVGTPLVLTLSGTTAVVTDPIVVHTGKIVRYLKFVKVVNGDAAQGIAAVNVVITGQEAPAR